MSEKSSAVAEFTAQVAPRRRTKGKRRRKQQPRYHVILWNDNDHTIDYVIRMMEELFRLPSERGFQIAREVDRTGRAICLTTTLEHAELKRDQIHAYGKDYGVAACQGSMSASIEAELV